MKLFELIARKISYTFAVSFYTVFAGWILGMFSFFLGTSFIIMSYDKLTAQLVVFLPIAIGIASTLHYIHYGLLTPLKIPALFKSLRAINESYKKKDDEDVENLQYVYQLYSDMPMYTMLAAALYTAISGLLIFAYALYEYFFKNSYTTPEMYAIIKIVTLCIIIITVLYGMSSYLLAEIITNNERARIYNELLRKGIRIRPRALIGIRIKFLFFVWLMVITLLTFTALMEKTRYYNEFNFGIIFSYLAASIVAAFVLMQITTQSIVNILNDLRRVTRVIASGGKGAFEVLSLEREFSAIEYALMEMAWEIDEYRHELETKVDQRTSELQDALENLKGRDDQIQKQLDMASVIQRSILPGQIEDWNELKFAVRYLAMEKIGGDFYDVYQLKNDKLGIIMADVSGHGIPAALVTTMAKMSFGNAGSKYDSPRKIFQEVNQSILDHVKTQDYMTCFMLSIDDEYNITYSNASHQKAILIRCDKEEVELLDTNGLFIGALEDARDSYDEKQNTLNYGDRIVLYTDGIPEALNENREEYSNRRLEQTVLANRTLPIEQFADTVLNDVRTFIGPAAAVDDITILVVELARDEAVDIIKNAKKLVNVHKYAEAIDMLEDGLLKFPQNQKIMYNLAKNYFRINNYQRAADCIEAYINNDRRNKNAFYIAGSVYFQMGNQQKAIEHYETALELDSGFVNALFALGVAYKKKGDFANAVKTFEKVINVDPDNKMALFELKDLREKAS